MTQNLECATLVNGVPVNLSYSWLRVPELGLPIQGNLGTNHVYYSKTYFQFAYGGNYQDTDFSALAHY